MKKRVVGILNESIDQIIDEYLKNHHIIYFSDSERRKKQYEWVKKKLDSWNKRKKCIYRGCEEKSIRKSHTIQKSGPLKTVSYNSVVLTPQFDQELGEVRLIEKGLSQASVFPGFCEEHEKLFFKYESEKKLNCEDFVLLQIYRSICREVVRLEHGLMNIKKSVSDYKKFRNKKLKELCKKKLGDNWLKINNVKIEKLNIKNDPVLMQAEETIKDTTTSLNQLKNEHLQEIEFELNGVENTELQPVVIEIDYFIPLTLSGLGSFYVKDHNHNKRVFAIIGVFPDSLKTSTTIVLHGKAADTEYIKGYIGRLKNSFDLLNMIEQFMIRGTDHWFINPLIWKQKNTEEQKEILEEILDDRKGIAHPMAHSIFDDIRKKMIDTWESNKQLDMIQQNIVAKERAKLRN